MKYDLMIVCTPKDFYLGESLCRELEKRGKRCLFNRRDLDNPDTIESDLQNMVSGNVVAILSNQFLENKGYSLLIKNLDVSDRITYLLQNDEAVAFPFKGGNVYLIDSRKGLTLPIIECIQNNSVPDKSILMNVDRVNDTSVAESDCSIDANNDNHRGGFIGTPVMIDENDDISLWFNQRHLLDSMEDAMIPVDDASPTIQRGIRYLKGEGVPQDSDRAVSFFKKSLNENNDDVFAIYYLGICSELGWGTDKDNAKALEYFSKAAVQNHTPSLFHKGMLELLDSESDTTACMELFEKVLSLQDIRGAYGIGLCYEKSGKFDEAFDKYSEAAELGYAPAQNAIGCFYSEGLSVKRDEKKALEWFALAADQNLIEGLANYGIRLFFCNVEDEMTKGETMLRTAAANGNYPSEDFLNRCEAEVLEFEKKQEEEKERLRAEQKKKEQMDELWSTLGDIGRNAFNTLIRDRHS